MFFLFTVPVWLGLLIYGVYLIIASTKQRQTPVLVISCRCCGTNNRMGAYACIRCGAGLVYECPRCHAITPADVVSSHLERKQPLICSCGTSLLPPGPGGPLQLTAQCATCGAEFPLGSSHCDSCGAAIYFCAECKAVVSGDLTVCSCGNRLL
jgi:hypothetical protein